jgi:molybdopterin molybdotransferase
VLATFGYMRVNVYRRPSIALLATGDELQEADREPGPGQIRNSNSHLLKAQLRRMGVDAEYLGIARDDPEELKRRIVSGLERDVLILTGGVSVGAYDFVREVLGALGLQVIFSRIAMRPGKPTVFARRGRNLLFGLPGNPLSAFVAFENLVRPALGRICGLSRPELPRVDAELLADMRQKTGRMSFLPAVVQWQTDGWKAQPLHFRGSSDIIGFCPANALIVFPGDKDRMSRGNRIEALLLPDYWERQMGSEG